MARAEDDYPTPRGPAAAQLAEAAAHHRAGRYHQAEVLYRRVLADDPDNPDAWQLLGLIAQQAGRPDAAVEYIRLALERRPGDATFLNNLGTVYEEQGDHERAEASLREAIRSDPGYASAHNNLGEVLKACGRVREALAWYRSALQCRPDFPQAESNLLMALNYDPDTSADEIWEEHRAWGARRLAQAPPPRPHARDPAPDRALRVGYLSPDFRRHAVARFIEPVLAHHDRTRFEVYLYAEVPVADAVSERLRGHATGWRVTVGRTAEEVAEQVRADGIDILVELAGHTRHNRLDVMLLRPAPVQVTYLGYPNTTGLTCIDYRITDAVVQPLQLPVRSAEQPVCLPGSFACFQPPAAAPPVASRPVVRAGRVTFGSHHPLLKLNAWVCQLWKRVLDSVPGSRLLLFRNEFTPLLAGQTRDRLAAQGIAADRVEVRHVEEKGDAYLEEYRDIDIVLDCFPFTGHTMTCEALWQGVPVVTLRGDRPAGRLSASVLTALELTELIADTPDEYIAAAARLAGDLPRLESLRRDLRPRMAVTVCDGAAFTRRLEECYRALWRRRTEPRSMAPTPPDPTRPAAPQVISLEWHERGLAHVVRLDYERAAACFGEAVRVDPAHALAYNSLGNALKHLGRYDEAIAAFRAGLELEPLQPSFHSNLGEVYKASCRFPEALTCYRLATLNLPPFSFAHHNYLVATNYVPDWDADAVFDEHRLWGLRAALRPPVAHPNPKHPDRPLRIGYVSADFREHPVARFIEPVLRHHDRAGFPVHLYAEVPVPDEVTHRLRGLRHGWSSTVGRSAEDVANQIRADGIDVLVDLTGHYAGSRLDVFALRPAPVQVSYLGYPNTSGLPAQDYWLSDAVLHPPGEPERAVEQVVRLPGAFFCFQPSATAPPVGPPPARERGWFTFGSHHNPHKLNDSVLALWAAALTAVPGSRLHLFRSQFYPPVADWLRERLRRHGVAPERVEFRQPPSIDAEYLAAYREIDLVLDAFPFGGHTTTCEALWQGVPVLTLRGDRPAARLSAAVLAPLGLSELIAGTPGEFVDAARRLAADPDHLAELRRGMRQRMAPLCDGAAFTRGLEATYRNLWRAWCEGQPRTPPVVPPVPARPTPRANLGASRTVEVIVAVRPGGRDRYPVTGDQARVRTRVIECADGNLSRLYRDAYLASGADAVVFKHDDMGFRDWDAFEAQLWGLLPRHPIVGVAGTRAFSPHRLPWWHQTAFAGTADGLNRGMVAHPVPAGEPTGDAGFAPTFYGPPGPVAVLDGVALAVLRRWDGDKLFGQFTERNVAGWWDVEFTRHFYDMAFTLNATREFHAVGFGAACYATVTDAFHESGGSIDREWEVAARRFVARYGGSRPFRV